MYNPHIYSLLCLYQYLPICKFLTKLLRLSEYYLSTLATNSDIWVNSDNLSSLEPLMASNARYSSCEILHLYDSAYNSVLCRPAHDSVTYLTGPFPQLQARSKLCGATWGVSWMLLWHPEGTRSVLGTFKQMRNLQHSIYFIWSQTCFLSLS